MSVTSGIPNKAERIERLTRRRRLRAALTLVLTLKRVARLLGETVVAGMTEADVAVDSVAAADDLAVIAEVAAFKADTEAAMAFLEKGPLDLASQRVGAADQSFESFDGFKEIGPAGDGFDYHHIVEQASNAGILPTQQLQSTANIVRIPRLLHEEISAIYAKPVRYGASFTAPESTFGARASTCNMRSAWMSSGRSAPCSRRASCL